MTGFTFLKVKPDTDTWAKVTSFQPLNSLVLCYI